MRTMKLMAVKPHRYGTRHLTAGEEYEAPIREAVAHVAARRAKFAKDKPARATVMPTAVQSEDALVPPEPQAEPDINDLRLQATQLGINVDGRWGVHRLQQEIAARRE